MIIVEQWKPVVGYEGLYEVSNLGRVKSLDRLCKSSKRSPQWMKGQILKTKINTHRQNRCTVALCKNGEASYPYIARLVLTSFVGPAPKGQDAAHWDGNPVNNCLENLRWATVSENALDKKRHGTDSSGIKNAMSKLTEDQVLYIKNNYRRNSYHDSNALELASKFNVARETILSIAGNKTWSHVA
jgi:hypothetical protein